MIDTEAEETDEKTAAAGTGETEKGSRPNGGRGPGDPDLAARAARAEPSRDAERLQYDPAAEDG